MVSKYLTRSSEAGEGGRKVKWAWCSSQGPGRARETAPGGGQPGAAHTHSSTLQGRPAGPQGAGAHCPAPRLGAPRPHNVYECVLTLDLLALVVQGHAVQVAVLRLGEEGSEDAGECQV